LRRVRSVFSSPRFRCPRFSLFFLLAFRGFLVLCFGVFGVFGRLVFIFFLSSFYLLFIFFLSSFYLFRGVLCVSRSEIKARPKPSTAPGARTARRP
jgi:hypothetical protein